MQAHKKQHRSQRIDFWLSKDCSDAQNCNSPNCLGSVSLKTRSGSIDIQYK
jgi:hypothetical protein